jgi:hypothetical protein
MLPSPPMMTASKPKISRAGPDRRVEIGAHGKKDAGDRDDRKRQRHGQRKDVAIVETHQLRHRLIVRRRAEGAAERGAIEQELQAGDDGNGDRRIAAGEGRRSRRPPRSESSRPRWRRP